MSEIVDVQYLEIEGNKKWGKIIQDVISEGFKQENLSNEDFYVNVILTNPSNIRNFNKNYRNIDKETDVLSFPMFEKNEIYNVKFGGQEVLGDIIISIQKVQEQANEYGHSFERELAYMAVHGFYHLMGEDHIKEEDKKIMREKEEKVLSALGIKRRED